MTLLSAPEISIDIPTEAQRLARKNWLANLDALRQTQLGIAQQLEPVEPDLEWIFGRDGTLTGQTADGRWWANCSIPLLAGRALLKTLDENRLGSCLLAPGHVGLLLAAREQVGPGAALIVLQPDTRIARIILGCRDFSADIKSHRLWFICGSEWEIALRSMFDHYPGLATPHRFIRTKLISPDIADPLIAAAQTIFSAVLVDRTKIITDLQNSKPNTSDQILLIGGSSFRLWDSGSDILQAELLDLADKHGQIAVVQRFDTDDPLSTSPVALAQAARACGSVVSINICRADSNNLVPIEIPWITWLNRPGAPPFSSAGPGDSLILADGHWRNIARNAGWPDNRVHICSWPVSAIRTADQSNASWHLTTHGSAVGFANQITAKPTLGILCDMHASEIPKSIEEFSSHAILWEMIEAELHTDPLVVDDADHYLRNRAGQLNIDIETLDRPRFIDNLILPAYQQGLARLLITAGIPIQIWGRGWELIPEFSDHTNGPLTTQEAFQTALAASTALLYCWPTRAAHPIDTTGKPVLHRSGREPSLFIRDAKRILLASNPPVVVDAENRNRLGRLVLELVQQTRGSHVHH